MVSSLGEEIDILQYNADDLLSFGAHVVTKGVSILLKDVFAF